MRRTVLLVVRRAAGGIRRHVCWLAPALAAGPFLPVVAGSLDADWVAELKSAGVGARACPPWSLPRLAFHLRPGIVHAHGYRAALWSRLLPGPRLVTAHNLPPGGGTLLGDPRATWLAVSHAVACALAARGVPEAQLRVLPGACPDDRRPSSAAARLRLGLPRNAEVVAYVGRLARGKGIEVLLEAFARLRQARPAACLVVAGAGPLAPQLEPPEGCRLIGPLRDPAPVYAAADLVVVPSLREGLGLVALEAQAAGRPVVAAATGGLAEVVRHRETGWLVPPGDPATLTMAMGALLADPQRRRRLGEAGRALALGRTLAAMVAAVTEAYQEAGRGCCR